MSVFSPTATGDDPHSSQPPTIPSMKLSVRTPLAVSILTLCACLTSSAAITNPLQIPDHVLWLEGDDFNGDGTTDTGTSGTVIDTWVDKSPGLGNNSLSRTGGFPTMEFGVANTHHAVFFGGDLQDKLDTLAPFLVSGNYSVFTVVQADAFGGSSHVLSGLNTTGTDPVLYRTGAGSYRFYSGQTTGNTDLQIGSAPGATPFRLFGYQIDATGSDTGLFQNSRVALEWNGPATLDGLRVGNLDRATPSSTDRPEAFHGQIAEVIIYNRSLSLSESRDVSLYLNNKYSLGFNIPTGAMTQIETGNVTGGTPSTLMPTSEPRMSGRTNVALSSNGGLAFAKDYIGPGSPRDFRPFRANDGLYADPAFGPPPAEEPWIAASLSSFVGVKLNAPMTIDRIGFQDEFDARRNGTLIFEYTDDDLSSVPLHPDLGLDPAAINLIGWDVLDVVEIADSTDTRHLYSFQALAGVTGVRVRIESTAAEFAVSELEVWAVPEPGTGLLALAGAVLLGFRRRRD